MSRLVIDLPEHQSAKSLAKGLRYMNRHATMPYGDHDAAESLAAAIEAAADKRYVVLDVDELAELGIDVERPANLVAIAGKLAVNHYPATGRLLRALAEQLDDPRPPEPKEFGAKVTARPHPKKDRQRFIRSDSSEVSDGEWIGESDQKARLWSELSDVTLGWDDETGGAS